MMRFFLRKHLLYRFTNICCIVGFFLSAPMFSLAQSSTGVQVEPVAKGTVSFSDMVKKDKTFDNEKLKLEFKEPPLLPIPQDLPIPEGMIPPEQRKESPQNDQGDFPPPGPVPGPLAPALSDNFEGLNDNNTRIPPDTNGAVGPNHLVVPLNSQVRIQTKTGSNLSTVSLLAFWQTGLPSIDDVFDPKIIYDPDSDRFLFVACAQRRDATSSMLLAVSASSDPTGAWHMWQFDGDASDTNWVDYPNIGVTGKWITFTSNMFAISGDTFAGVNIWAVDKTSALDGGAVNSTLFFQTSSGATHVPCLTYNSSEPTQYLINTWNSNFSGSGYLRTYTITGSATSPVWAVGNFALSTPWNSSFLDAPQLNSPELIETNEDRMMNAVLRNGSLWCTHAVALPSASPTHTAVKWWEIDPETGTPLQSGVIDDYSTDGLYYYFPSVAVNSEDEAIVGFSGSSSTTYAAGYYTYRSPADASGTMQSVATVKIGEATYYKTFGGSRNRWGDYSGAMIDPVDDLTMWTIQEYADSPSSLWGTWWGKLDSQIQPTATPTATGTVTETPTETVTETPTETGTETPTPTVTETQPAPTSTSTVTPTPTITETEVPTATSTETPTVTPTATPTPLVDYNSSTIGAGGGSFQAGPNGFYTLPSLNVPAGALVTDITFEIFEPAEADRRGIRAAVQYEPSGTPFSASAEITLEFRVDDIPGGYTENDMRIFRWSDTLMNWEEIDDTQTLQQINATTWTLTADIDHLSVYGVLTADSRIDVWRVY